MRCHLPISRSITTSSSARKTARPFIAAAWREGLHAYLGGVVRQAEGVPEAIGGVADHVHLILGLRATDCLVDEVRDVKAISSLDA